MFQLSKTKLNRAKLFSTRTIFSISVYVYRLVRKKKSLTSLCRLKCCKKLHVQCVTHISKTIIITILANWPCASVTWLIKFQDFRIVHFFLQEKCVMDVIF